jgi:hypothetical protein
VDCDDKHPEADVQDLDVSHSANNPICLLIVNKRKKAGALEQVEGMGARSTGMTNSMKERAKEALAGRTGETDDED